MIDNILIMLFAFGSVIYAYSLGVSHGRRQILDKVEGWIKEKKPSDRTPQP